MERNINSLIGYGMQATDGEIGEVVDFTLMMKHGPSVTWW